MRCGGHELDVPSYWISIYFYSVWFHLRSIFHWKVYSLKEKKKTRAGWLPDRYLPVSSAVPAAALLPVLLCLCFLYHNFSWIILLDDEAFLLVEELLRPDEAKKAANSWMLRTIVAYDRFFLSRTVDSEIVTKGVCCFRTVGKQNTISTRQCPQGRKQNTSRFERPGSWAILPGHGKEKAEFLGDSETPTRTIQPHGYK
jgi:hypothetical protein